MGKASVKVEGGKMVEVETRRSKVRLTGDFFIEPPEAREHIEENLENLDENSSRGEVVEAVEQVEAELIGFSPEDIAEAYSEAVEK